MDSLPISALDLFVIAVVIVSALLAFMRGFVKEVLAIGAWVGAVLGALYFRPMAQPIARQFIPIDWAADAAALVALFLAIMLVLSIITTSLSKTVKASALSGLDRALGVLFGVARAAVILAIMLMVGEWLMGNNERPRWMTTAKTLPVIEAVSNEIQGLMPDSFMAAEKAARGAGDTARQAIDAKQTFDRLTQPTPASGDSNAPGYDAKERSDMERLLQGTGIEASTVEEAGKAQLQQMIDSGRLNPQQKQIAERLLSDPAMQARARAEAQRLLGSGQIDPAKMEKAKEMLAKQGIDPTMINQLQGLVRGGNIDPAKLQELQKMLDKAPAGAPSQ